MKNNLLTAALLTQLFMSCVMRAETAEPAPPPETGLIGHWTLDAENDKLVKDHSASHADCVIKGITPTPQVTGGFGRAVMFYGKDGYLTSPDSAKLNLSGAFTISFWLNPSEWSDDPSSGIVSKKGSDRERGYVIYNDGQKPSKINLRIVGTAGGHDLTSASDVDEDVWQHWAVTYDPGAKTAVWYKNGKLDKAYSSISIGDTSNNAEFHVGHAQTWNGFYSGMLLDLKMFNRALSAEEIQSEYALRSSIVESEPPVAPLPVAWRVVTIKYPTADAVVAGCTVLEAGAKGDGKTDDAPAFRRALNAMAQAGGGTVFAPEGRYVIKGNLKIPTGVTLRGEWEKPETGVPIHGTVLMAYAGRGQTEGPAFIGLRPCSGIRDMAIWYPEQDAGHIVPYPFCVKQLGGDSATMKNVTLVNPYQGILIAHSSELHYLHNIYGSPLAIGLEVDFVSDTGRADNIHFSPDFWSGSGLPDAPTHDGPHAAWMSANGTALLYLRNEWIFSAFVSVSGYKTGLEILSSPIYGATNGQVYAYDITNCGTAVRVNGANFAGTSFTECLLEGHEYGVVTTPAFNSRLLFHTCTIRGGKQAALLDGVADQTVMFHHCAFSGAVERTSGNLTLLGCSITAPGEHVRLGKKTNAVTIAGGTFNGPPRIVNDSGSKLIKITPEPVPESSLPKFPKPEDKTCKPGKSALYIVTDPAWSAKKDGVTDDTAAIQKALDAAAANGGGIVFLPGGEYSVRGHLSIPSGVEFRGVYDVPHHSVGRGSVLRVYAGRNDPAAEPFIVMAAGSGLRGLTFFYPEQKIAAVVPYPFLIQGRGADIYVADICVVNSYSMLDFMTYRCDRHYLDYAAGVALKTGMAVGGGSIGGEIRNCLLQTHYWNRSPLTSSDGSNGFQTVQARHNQVWEYQHENLEAYVFGDCWNELLYQNVVFGSHTGLHFISQKGTGASGCLVLGYGADGSRIPMAFDGLGPEGVDVINSQLVSMNSTASVPAPDKRHIECGDKLNATARLYNTTLWGQPMANSVTVNGGTLMLELVSFNEYAPFAIGKGKLVLVNAYLGRPFTESPELEVRDSGQVSLIGTLSPMGMRLDRDTKPASVTDKFANQRSVAMP